MLIHNRYAIVDMLANARMRDLQGGQSQSRDC